MKKFYFQYAQRGQVVIEYVLLLVCVVVVASLLIDIVKIGDPQTGTGGGFVIEYWRKVIRFIGEDL